MWYYVDVVFTEALKTSQWVRRKKWASWMLVKRGGPVLAASTVHWNELTWDDLVADDWVGYTMNDESVHDDDEATIRFKLMELE